jgi:5-methylcytosine-specific restriction endonuclease McrA
MDEQTHDDLRWLQDAMRRECPDGDAAAIVARALKVLREQVERKAFAATTRPRPSQAVIAGSRAIRAAVQRAVWHRDGGQCAFVAGTGRRCDERSYLEYHHAIVPFARGGEATVDNIALRCRAHNEYEAELLFGQYESQVREAPAAYGLATCSGTRRASDDSRVRA